MRINVVQSGGQRERGRAGGECTADTSTVLHVDIVHIVQRPQYIRYFKCLTNV